MITIGIILFIIGIIAEAYAIVYEIEELMMAAVLTILIGLFLIAYGAYRSGHSTVKTYGKETPLSIYHNNNIYYIYKDSLITENGEDEVRDGKWKEAYIELLTSKDVVDCINDTSIYVDNTMSNRIITPRIIQSSPIYTISPTALFPEEWSLAKKGDTLIVLDVKNGVPEIGFFNYKNR